MTQHSRRDFVRSAAASSLLLATETNLGWASGLADPTGEVTVWATCRDLRHARIDPLEWKPVGLARADAIVIDTAHRKQEILGFGGALTDATCFLLGQLPAEQRQNLMHDLFAPDAMNLNVCRTTIGSSDYSVSPYSYDDSIDPDPELNKFSIDHDRAYILPILQQARSLNPQLFLFSSPWSPPGWMKSGNTLFGGTMRSANFAAYAAYFRKFLEAYKDAGVQINAVTVQNEVDSEQEGKMPQCIWGQQYEVEFVKHHLGPLLRKDAPETKIWFLDHNYDLWGRALDELGDADFSQYVDGIAWHGYMGHPSSMTLVHDQYPQKHAYWTEGGPSLSQPRYETDWAKWGEFFNGILNNWAKSITAWNLVLDQNGKPNIGPFDCAGTVTLESGSNKVTRSGQYWALSHLSKHIRRGATAIATNSMEPPPSGGALLDEDESTALTRSAFRNPDGTMVVVLANRGDHRQVQLLVGNKAVDISVPADSLLTLQWV